MKNTPEKSSQPETELLNRCVAGDLEAFEKLVRQFQKYAYTLAYKILWNEEDAKDIVQETFIRVWKNIFKYDTKVKFTTWLYKIVTNLCFDKLKSDKRRKRHISPAAENKEINDLPNTSDPVKEITNQDLVEKVHLLSGGLSAKQRMVFTLRDLQDVDIPEIAEILQMSTGAVKSNLYLARMTIRKKLEESDI